jgi:hypothetical protein
MAPVTAQTDTLQDSSLATTTKDPSTMTFGDLIHHEAQPKHADTPMKEAADARSVRRITGGSGDAPRLPP